MALTVVMDLTKLNTMAEIIAGLSSGRTIVNIVRTELARCVREASSSDLSICESADIPERIPTGIFLKINEIIIIMAVPLISIGAVLNAST